MVQKYNARIDELGSTHTGTQAVVGDVLADPPQSILEIERYHDFHLITVGAALHHFADTGAAVERLARRLRPGGVLYIQDMLNTGRGGEEGAKARGFTFEELESLMSNAGLVKFRFEALPDPFEIEVPMAGVLKIKCFIASGMKRQ
jgi:SAM-dependent methyltransferase